MRCQESGKLAVGDIVTEIDDQLVYGKSALEVTQVSATADLHFFLSEPLPVSPSLTEPLEGCRR